MDRIARYLDLGGWSAFCIAMAIVIFAPERMWWSAPLHLFAGILFVVSIVEQRRRARRSCPDEDAATGGRS